MVLALLESPHPATQVLVPQGTEAAARTLLASPLWVDALAAGYVHLPHACSVIYETYSG